MTTLRMRNSGQTPLKGALVIGIRNLSNPTVNMLSPDGVAPDGMPYLVLDPEGGAQELTTGSSTAERPLSFRNPDGTRFSYELVVLGRVNRAPRFTTIPVVEAAIGRPYQYPAQATDPDGDTLTYALLEGPVGMTMEPGAGLVSFTPESVNRGTHSVVLRASDGRGGVAEQRFALIVQEPPANRPPTFTSVPIVQVVAGKPYAYVAQASDPDGDALAYAVGSGPAGFGIHTVTGATSWNPTVADLGPHPVTLGVSDGRGGLATQSFTLRVLPDPLNHPPIIVSTPVATAYAGTPYVYDVEALDPDDDPLVYSLTSSPLGMDIDAESGLITWQPCIPTAEFITTNSSARAIATDTSGNIIIAGSFGRTTSLDPCGSADVLHTADGINSLLVAKYTPSGHLLWARGTTGPGDCSGHGVALDTEGNVYVTGLYRGTVDFDPGPGTWFGPPSAESPSNGNGIFVLKLSQQGDFAWAAPIPNPTGVGSGSGYDLKVDRAGYVYATGSFAGNADFDPGPGIFELTSNSADVAYIWKLAPDGRFVWARQVDHHGSLSSRGWSLDLDSGGNPCVTGYFRGSQDFDPGPGVTTLSADPNFDVFVWKLSSSGAFLWAHAFHAPESSGSNDGLASQLFVAPDDSVYVTGTFAGKLYYDSANTAPILTALVSADMFLARIDPGGALQWTRRTGGLISPLQGGPYYLDLARSPDGDIHLLSHLIGTQDVDPGSGVLEFSTTDPAEMLVSRFTPDGNFLSARVIRRSGTELLGGIAFGQDGREHVAATVSTPAGPMRGLYVSGFSGNSVPVAVRVEDGRGGSDEQAFEIQVAAQSPNQAPYITTSPPTVVQGGTAYLYDVDAIDPDADPLEFSLVESPAGMHIEGDTGIITWDAPCIPDGHFVLRNSPRTTGTAIVADLTGNVTIAGTFGGRVNLDPCGNNGYVQEAAGGGIFLAKYTASGNLIWTRTIGGPGQPDGICTDPLANLYIIGQYRTSVDMDPGPGVDLSPYSEGIAPFILKLDSSGTFRWAVSVPQVPGYYAGGHSVAVDSSGNVYGHGTFVGTGDFDPGPAVENRTAEGAMSDFLWKLDPNGRLLWVRTFGPSIIGSGWGLVLDGEGNPTIAGRFSQNIDVNPGPGSHWLSPEGEDIFVVKLTSAGEFLWAHTFGAPGNDERLQRLGVAPDGSVYVMGGFTGTLKLDGTATIGTSDGIRNMFLGKLAADGAFRWARRTGGRWGLWDGWYAGIAVDDAGQIHLNTPFSGTVDADPGDGVAMFTSRGSTDMLVSSFDEGGRFLSGRSIGGVRQDLAYGIAVSPRGNVQAIGTIDETPEIPSPPDGGLYVDGFPDASYSTPVAVYVDDGRGGSDQQAFNLTVRRAGSGEISGSVFWDSNADGVRRWELTKESRNNNLIN